VVDLASGKKTAVEYLMAMLEDDDTLGVMADPRTVMAEAEPANNVDTEPVDVTTLTVVVEVAYEGDTEEKDPEAFSNVKPEEPTELTLSKVFPRMSRVEVQVEARQAYVVEVEDWPSAD